MPVNSVSLCSNLFPSEIGTNQKRVPLKSLRSPSFSSKLRFLRKSTQNSSGVGPDDGVIIVDHGPRRKESNIMLCKKSLTKSIMQLIGNVWILIFNYYNYSNDQHAYIK
ncbi:sirohydrochlorin ferrochelatase [Trifolium repens]|nr:sirohydrochlorin ferrochelatase [Trifolium repens]